MTDKETIEFIKNVRKITKDITSSKDKSKKMLEEIGTHTKKGNLRKEYKCIDN
ncbi:MAG: hypothetical protein R6V04_10790 [bacterium]